MDLALPCPLDAGWELVRMVVLPRQGADGLPLGGFSAAAFQPGPDRLWLLSDAPQGHLVPWGGLAQLLNGMASALAPGPRLLLRDANGQPLPEGFDGEGLVLEGSNAWITSEGRRTPDRTARLIRIRYQHWPTEGGAAAAAALEGAARSRSCTQSGAGIPNGVGTIGAAARR